MRIKGSVGDGFLLCFLLNLLFNFWWGTIAFILFVLRIWIPFSIFIPFAALFIWVGIALAGTVIIFLAVNVSSEPEPQRENLNPYSAKNSDVFPLADSAEENLDSGSDEDSDSDSNNQI